MTTEETQQEVANEPTEAQQLAAGFDDSHEPEVPQEEPAVVEEEAKTEPQEEPTEEVKEEVKEEAKEPETVVITAEQWNALQSKLSEIETFKQQAARSIDQSLGKYGELNRTLQQMQQKPQGGVQLSKDKFKRLSADFPEMAALLADDLNEAFSGPAPAPEQTPQTIDPADLERRVQERVAKEIEAIAIKSEMRELSRRHSDWNEVVVSDDFNKWGATLPVDQWNALRSSNDADEISKGLDTYKAFKKEADAAAAAALAKSQKLQSASKRLEAAITPTGTAGGPSQLTERDLFLQGFKSP